MPPSETVLHANAASYAALAEHLDSHFAHIPPPTAVPLTTVVYIIDYPTQADIEPSDDRIYDVLLQFLSEWPHVATNIKELVLAARDTIPPHHISLAVLRSIARYVSSLTRLRVYGFQWGVGPLPSQRPTRAIRMELLELVDIYANAGTSPFESMSLAESWDEVRAIDVDHHGHSCSDALQSSQVSNLSLRAEQFGEPTLSLPIKSDVFLGLATLSLTGVGSSHAQAFSTVVTQNCTTLSALKLSFIDEDVLHLADVWDLSCLLRCTSLLRVALVLPLDAVSLHGPRNLPSASPQSCITHVVQSLPASCESFGIGLRVGEWTERRVGKEVQKMDWVAIGETLAAKTALDMLYVDIDRRDESRDPFLGWLHLPGAPTSSVWYGVKEGGRSDWKIVDLRAGDNTLTLYRHSTTRAEVQNKSALRLGSATRLQLP